MSVCIKLFIYNSSRTSRLPFGSTKSRPFFPDHLFTSTDNARPELRLTAARLTTITLIKTLTRSTIATITIN
ncbi:hypothetical protein Glove_724g13 [Diversispora epigaea]|uniref:Uncharacterized protein n=1 Tax=Diversispora epigaea TaxID=1348612 RepID=A0A397G8R1_9GLOM|nr:hypothetical protein Glove_724g13 [Diversispora epigaea]